MSIELTEDDLEALDPWEALAYCECGEEFCDCEPRSLAPVVRSIVAAKVAEALRDAADEIDAEHDLKFAVEAVGTAWRHAIETAAGIARKHAESRDPQATTSERKSEREEEIAAYRKRLREHFFAEDAACRHGRR